MRLKSKKQFAITALLVMSFLKTTPTKADCAAECKKVIQAADAAIQAENKQIQDQGKTITDLQRALADSNAVADSESRALSAWYHNPVITTTLGILVGGFGAVYLLKKK